jgi:hypothetical protein
MKALDSLKISLAIIFVLLRVSAGKAEDERIFVDFKINNKPVRFSFDSGTGIPFLLYSTTSQRLGLKAGQPPANNQIEAGQTAIRWTELCDFELGSTNAKTSFAVVDIPAYLSSKWPEDGTMGWDAISNNIFSLDCDSHRINLLTNVPVDSAGWIKLCVLTNNDDLALELSESKNEKLALALDTGSSYGVKLNPKRWHDWKSQNTDQPITLEAYYTPNPGMVVSEESWADQISLGPLTLTDTPVMEANSSDLALHTSPQTRFEATLGFAALKRLDVIIDGKHGIAYLRPKSTPPLPYEHNRTGAVFVPRENQNTDLVAHVVNGSPAYEAGIRNGDVLLKIGELDVTKWRTDPNVLPLSRFWNSPVGTKLELTLRRNETLFNASIILRNILPPDGLKNSK